MRTVNTLPVIDPAKLTLRLEPVSHPNWVYELKYDGFRAILYKQTESACLVSRKGYEFKKFPKLSEALIAELPARNAILDGEIVCVDERGRPHFSDLMFNRGDPRFYAFDLLWLDGVDLRQRPLLERKRRLRELLPKKSSHVLYVDHVESEAWRFFDLVCNQDLEGIVCKPRTSPYGNWWIKVKNPEYSQAEGRHELFERFRSAARIL